MAFSSISSFQSTMIRSGPPTLGTLWSNKLASLGNIQMMFNSLNISNDGNYMLIINSNYSPVYLTTNGGTSWTTISGIQNIYVTTMSASGQYMYAASTNASPTFFYSSNFGVTWSSYSLTSIVGSSNASFSTICSSSTGQYVVACIYNKSVYLSQNFGLTFTNIGSNVGSGTNPWNMATISPDGTKIAVTNDIANSSTCTYYTTNNGTSWSAIGPSISTSNIIPTINITNSGLMLFSTFASSVIYITRNSGGTWTSNSSLSTVITTQGMSADGQIMCIGSYGANYIWYSKDAGITWNAALSLGHNSLQCQSISVSNNGKYMAIICVENNTTWAIEVSW